MTNAGQITALARSLTRQKSESAWVEYKVNNGKPDEIGENISAIANSAARAGRPRGYIVWGVEDVTRKIVGTKFDPSTAKYGAEDLEPWLLRMLDPQVALAFHECELEGLRLVVLEIDRAHSSPVRFSGKDFIRVGSYTKPLKDFPHMEAELWRAFDNTPFESLVQHEAISANEVVNLLSIESYFSLLGIVGLPSIDGILKYLEGDRMIRRSASTGWDITNLGALCLAKKLEEFPRLQRKAVRFVQYADSSRTQALDGIDGAKGYATGFDGLLGYIQAKLPRREVTDPFRRTVEGFPPVAVRELIANALIHQDFRVAGAGPLVELFPDRLEISNPGVPLVDTRRLLDAPPQSRNEALASFMRRAKICEERGSGVDKAAMAAEKDLLPAPAFRASTASTVSVIFGRREDAQMTKAERLWTTYMHASLRYVNGSDVTNRTLRERLGLDQKNSARVSRLLGEALEAGLIVPLDPSVGAKAMRYLPYWAVDSPTSESEIA